MCWRTIKSDYLYGISPVSALLDFTFFPGGSRVLSYQKGSDILPILLCYQPPLPNMLCFCITLQNTG